MPPWKKRYVNGCQIINSDQTILGTSPNNGKKRPSAFDRVCKTKIPKLTETNTFIALVNKVGLYENSPGFD
tara:strand:- start:270 stop:482 length:213 start_codon:yes stop_codon:yes gene_type:complete